MNMNDNLVDSVRGKEIHMRPYMPIIVDKVWGKEIHVANNNRYCGKILELKRDCRCSIHFHMLKHETFYIVSGYVLMEIAENGEKKIKYTYKMNIGDVITVPPGTAHRFSGIIDSKIMEVSTTDDIEDSYRLSPSEYVKDGSSEWIFKGVTDYQAFMEGSSIF